MFAIPNFFSKDQLNSFPSFIPKQQVNLGLDLQGGSHLLLEVDTVEIIKERLENLNSDVRRVLKKNNIQYKFAPLKSFYNCYKVFRIKRSTTN